MHSASKVLGSFQLALDECFVDDHLGSDIRQFESLPSCHLSSHRFEIPLHPIDTH